MDELGSVALLYCVWFTLLVHFAAGLAVAILGIGWMVIAAIKVVRQWADITRAVTSGAYYRAPARGGRKIYPAPATSADLDRAFIAEISVGEGEQGAGGAEGEGEGRRNAV